MKLIKTLRGEANKTWSGERQREKKRLRSASRNHFFIAEAPKHTRTDKKRQRMRDKNYEEKKTLLRLSSLSRWVMEGNLKTKLEMVKWIYPHTVQSPRPWQAFNICWKGRERPDSSDERAVRMARHDNTISPSWWNGGNGEKKQKL